MREARDNSIGASDFFNKIISELLAVNIMIDEEDKALILLSSLSESYAHIISTMLYGKETLILKEVTSTLLSHEIKKIPNQVVTPRFPKYAETESRRESATYIREEITPHIYAKPKVT